MAGRWCIRDLSRSGKESVGEERKCGGRPGLKLRVRTPAPRATSTLVGSNAGKLEGARCSWTGWEEAEEEMVATSEKDKEKKERDEEDGEGNE